MHSPRRACAAIALVAAAGGVLGGCSDAPAGYGHLTVADLTGPAAPGHFVGDPVPVIGRLDALPNGCLTVTVGGAARFPFWPTGTTVQPDASGHDAYVVRIPDGPSLGTGDWFAATAVIDGSTEPFPGQDDGGSKVGGLVGFCGIAAPAVALADAASVRGPLTAAPFDLLTHCGIDELRAPDGRWFERTGGALDDGNGNPPDGWGNPGQAGRLVVADDLATFSDDLGHVEEFRLRVGATEPKRICA